MLSDRELGDLKLRTLPTHFQELSTKLHLLLQMETPFVFSARAHSVFPVYDTALFLFPSLLIIQSTRGFINTQAGFTVYFVKR